VGRRVVVRVRAGSTRELLRSLWSGKERDRHKGPGVCSAWYDTDFVGMDGPGGGRFETAAALETISRD
jgi:hypothetical protein